MWAAVILVTSIAGAAAITWFTVLETNGSKLKKEDIGLYGEITQKKDEPDYFKNAIANTENLKKGSEDTLKALEEKIEQKEVDANDKATKETLQASKDAIAKHQTKINYLKTIQDKGLNGIDYSLMNILKSGGTFLVAALILNLLLKQLLKIVKPSKNE